MFLLDTDVLSASRRPEKASTQLAAWVANTNPRSMFLSAVTILEIKIGALRLFGRDQVRAAELEAWISGLVLVGFQGRIIPYDSITALLCAQFHVSRTPPERDAMIAATALQHRLTVVTHNTRDFRRWGVPLLDPSES